VKLREGKTQFSRGPIIQILLIKHPELGAGRIVQSLPELPRQVGAYFGAVQR